MATDFKLVTPDHVVEASVGDGVTLPCQLSPETSAVAIEIRWFKGTDCIYLYKNGHETVREDYEGRVSVNTQELQRGDVSLTLRKRREEDGGVYTCQVISGEHKEEGRVGLITSLRDQWRDQWKGWESLLIDMGVDMGVAQRLSRWLARKAGRSALKAGLTAPEYVKTRMKMGITAEKRKRMEESVQSLEIPVPERLTVSSITASSANLNWLVSPEMKQTPHSFLVSYQSEGTEPKSISTESCSTDITSLKPGTDYTVKERKRMEESVQSLVSPRRVLCDVCLNPAVKTCVTCRDSYCMTCIRPHYSDPDLERHQLQDLQDQSLCQQHHKQLKFYCRTDQSAICSRCLLKDHMGHDVGEQLPSPRGQIQFPSVQPHSVTLRWSPPEGAPGPHSYRVTWSGGQEQCSIVVKGFQAEVTGLLPGEKYQFAVVTLSEDGRQSPSVGGSVHTEIPVPERLTVSSITESSASLSWLVSPEMKQTPHSFLVSYQSEGTEPKSISTGSCSTDITGLKPGTDYTVKVYTELRYGGKSQPASVQMKTGYMQAPVCLIDNGTDGRMSVQQEALQILEQIQQPVVVVAVVGLYRTGKSYLLNRMAGQKKGFALGSTIESKTKGIWMWCVPHPSKPGHTLVLLDTEGLGDVEKGDEKHDTWIFCLAVLLSSTLVYNSKGTIDNNALEKLHCVTEMTERIKVQSSKHDQTTELMRVFPSFVWTVRDFTLELELKGKPITADEYLENALKLKSGQVSRVPEASTVTSVKAASPVPSLAQSSPMDQTQPGLTDSQSEGTGPKSPSTAGRGLTPDPESQHEEMTPPSSVTKEIPVPESLTVSSITASSASLSWLVSPEMKQTPHSFLVSYQSEGTETKSISTESCSTDITGLKPGTDYTVEVYTELQHGGKSQPASVQMKTGLTAELTRQDQLRQGLRNFFAVRRCFVFDQPTNGKNMKRMGELTDAELDSSFVEEAQKFCSYIFSNSKPKAMRGGLGVTGRMLGILAKTYVEAIRSGHVLCLESAVESLAKIENDRAITEALEFYQREMERWVRLPSETQEALSMIHAAAEKQAVDIFVRGSFNDHEHKYQLELMASVKKEYEEWCGRNVEESRRVCRAVLSRVFAPLEESVTGGAFMQPGGYKAFQTALDNAIHLYREEKGKGLLREEVLTDYLKDKSAVGENILAADCSLTEAQQRMEEDKRKQEVAEQQQKLLEEQKRIQEQAILDQKRSSEVNNRRMAEKMEEERQRAKEELERVLNAKLKEQSQSLEEGFQDRGQKLGEEVKKLKEELKSLDKKRSSWAGKLGSTLQGVGMVAVFVPGMQLPALATMGAGKLIGWLARRKK